MTTRIRSLVLAAALAATAAVAAGASAAPGATLPGTQLAPVKSYLLDHTTQLHGLHEGVPRRREPLLRDRQGADFDYAGARRRSAAVRKRPRAREGALDRGQPVLRARRGRRRRHAVARRLRRDPRRRLEREGGSGERRAVRPEARRTASVLRKPGNLFNLTEGMLWGTLPEYVGDDASDLDGDGKRRVRRGAARTRTCSRPPPTRSSSTPASSTARRGPGADRVGRVHGGRRDGADDERVLRPVEGLALRPRRPGAAASRSTSSRGSRTSATSSAACA